MAAGCPGPGSALHLVLRATALAVEMVIPMVDKIGAVFNINLGAGRSAPPADAQPPAKEMLLTAANPHQELAHFAFVGIGPHFERDHRESPLLRSKHKLPGLDGEALR